VPTGGDISAASTNSDGSKKDTEVDADNVLTRSVVIVDVSVNVTALALDAALVLEAIT
jgi:hypothetical protein